MRDAIRTEYGVTQPYSINHPIDKLGRGLNALLYSPVVLLSIALRMDYGRRRR